LGVPLAWPQHPGGMKKRWLACLALVAALGLALPARAGTTEVGVGVILVSGTHTEQTGAKATAGLVPAPLLTLDHRGAHWGFFLEAIPPLGPVQISNNVLGLKSTQLSYLAGSVRFEVSPQTRVGIGEMMYNQQSVYQYGGIPVGVLTSTVDTDRSRIVGAKFELLQSLRTTKKSLLTANVTLAPSLRGALGEQSTYTYEGEGSLSSPWFAVSEAGSQVSGMLENAVRENARLTLHYGVRYINLSMHFSNGALADRNAFVVPFIGVSTAFGR
jgi:hypothetical protein